MHNDPVRRGWVSSPWGLAVVKLAVLPMKCACPAWIDWTKRAAQTCPFGTSQTPKGRSVRRPANSAII